MSWNNVPLANQRIKDTQGPIRLNFVNLQTAFSVNHFPIDNPTNNGKHRVVTLPEWAMPPEATSDPITTLNEMALFTKMSPTTTVSELYLRRENNGTIIPLSEANTTSTGWSYLPSGILLKWGEFNGFGNATTLYSGPAFTATPVMFQLTLVRTLSTVDVQVYLDSFTGGAGANTKDQLAVYITRLSSPSTATNGTIRYLVAGV